MKAKKKKYFRLNWVLINEVAIGPAPLKQSHLDQIKKEGIKSIFSLCSEKEAPTPEGIKDQFNCQRFILPDHKTGKFPTSEELNKALVKLEEIIEKGPVFVHCVAAMERSPLICMAWLIKKHNLNTQQSLDYLMQIHPGTNPLPGQLDLLNKLSKSK